MLTDQQRTERAAEQAAKALGEIDPKDQSPITRADARSLGALLAAIALSTSLAGSGG